MRAALALLMVLAAGAAGAHDGVEHESAEEAAAHQAAVPTPNLPFPVDIHAKFSLIDQSGRAVSDEDFAGQPMAIFFGYANCEAICSVALPRLSEALDIMGDTGSGIAPILITVDPARDTPEAMAEALPKWHERLIGLTGTDAALAAAREAFQVETSQVAEDINGDPIYAHGSFIYFVGGDGKVLTVLPPILGPDRMAEVMQGYL